MLKKGILRRITISSLALIILLITYFFPTKLANTNQYKQTLTYTDIQKNVIYLLNKDSYVSRVSVVINNKETIKQIREIIKMMTLKSHESEYLPDGFSGVLPIGTEINNVTLEDKLLKIDFSKEFLNTTKEKERKMVESLIYTLTEFPEVENILIFVDGSQLLTLPFSQEKLPPLLNKNFGINKKYDIDSLKDTSKTTIYYASKEKEYLYYIPITYISNSEQEKVEIIIEKLKNSPIYESNLISYLHASAELKNYEILEQEIKLSFNEFLLDDLTHSTITEEVQYTLFLSLRDTYNIKQVEFSVNHEDKNVNLVINSLE